MMTVKPNSIEIVVNGAPATVPPGQTVNELLGHLGVRADRVAVEMNRGIVHQRNWGTTLVEPDAQIEIVEFVGGG
jgi:sulfur carrier protein